MIVDKELYILFLENRLKEVKLLHTNEIAENKRLKGLLDMDSSLDDAIIKDAELIRELKAENNELKQGLFTSDVDELKAEIKELKAENESLKSNSLKNSSLKEYKQEAEEYFHHNPQAKSVSFYMLDDCDVDEIDGSQHDPIVEIYNEGSN